MTADEIRAMATGVAMGTCPSAGRVAHALDAYADLVERVAEQQATIARLQQALGRRGPRS
jgi:hypothetical protein